MNQPTLSVIIPNYNHGHYLRQLLEAILKQSFQPIEIILVDDASTDNSLKIIESMMREHPIIKLVQNEKNMGAIYTEIKGMGFTKGDYFLSFSADDMILPGLFEKSMDLLAKYPEAGLCSPLAMHMDENGNEIPFTPSLPQIAKRPRYFSPDEALKIFLERGFWLSTIAAIWRKKAVMEAGAFTLESGGYIDAFSMYLLSLNYGVCFIPEPLGVLRVGPNRFSSKFMINPNMYLELIGPMEKLTRGKYSDKFPKEFVEDLKKKELYTYSSIALHELKLAQDKCLEHLKHALEKPKALDHVFLSINKVVYQIQKYLAKTYMFFRLRKMNFYLLIKLLYRLKSYF